MLDITNIPPPRVALIDERTGLMSREWYRFFLNLFQLTGSGTNDASLTDLQITPPNWDLSGDLGEVYSNALVAQFTDTQAREEIATLMNQVQALNSAPIETPQIKSPRYGSFYDTTTQTAAAINTAYGMTFNSTDLSNGVYIGSPTSRIYVDKIGVYNIQFSAQLIKSSAAAKNVWIWIRINGSDVANSATEVTLGGSNAAVVASWNFIEKLNDGDYFELMWSTDDTNCSIVAAGAAAPVPAIPSIILTVTDNISA